MIEALEEGVVPWRKPWTTMGAHRNLISGREYRGINVFLTALSAMRGGYARPLWLTIKQANQLGGRVRKGEKGTMVVFWEPRIVKRKNDKGEEEDHRSLVFKQYYVWNVEQIDGLVLPELPVAAGAAEDDRAERVWEGSGRATLGSRRCSIAATRRSTRSGSTRSRCLRASGSRARRRTTRFCSTKRSTARARSSA
jgi:antirestriction protein ArdC